MSLCFIGVLMGPKTQFLMKLVDTLDKHISVESSYLLLHNIKP